MIQHHLRVPPGPVDLGEWATDATPGFDGDKEEGKAALEEVGAELSELQERLFAEGRVADDADDADCRPGRGVLLVLQGMDTSGKGGVVRHTVGLVDPQGVDITAFKKPTEEELSHHFLWRIRKALPGLGRIGVFDRSHYEDVLIARVRELAEPDVIEQRYDEINAFEAEVLASGVRVVKVMLHVSPETQKERLLERLDRHDKHWKFNPGDIDERQKWGDYQRAYEVALERTNTEVAPWHVVPADRKWYRNLAVAMLLRQTLQAMAPAWTRVDLDVEEQRRRLEQEDPLQ